MKNSNDVVIVSGCRTPIGDLGGSLADLRAHELGAVVIKELIKRIGLSPDQVSELILGDCTQCPDEGNTARTAWLKAGFPHEVPAVTVNRQCASAMQSIVMGYTQIKAGESEIILAGGAESMSNAPYTLKKARFGYRLGHGELSDAAWEILHSGSIALGDTFIMGQTAENLADKYGISREAQDEVALRSHQNAQAATESGRFRDEIVSVSVPQKKGEPKIVDKDEHIRFNLGMNDLSRLKPAFKPGGTVTAGNSSGINDGAAGVILMQRDYAENLGLEPMATILSVATPGVNPRLMGYGPVPSSEKALIKAGLALTDIELIEVNEAFAAQYLAVERGLNLNREITNVNGSGIGLGHPIGCTGTRIVVSLLYEMIRRGLSLGLATLCVGGGMGMTTIIRRDLF